MTRGRVIGFVAVVLALSFATSCGKPQQAATKTGANRGGQATLETGAFTYAQLSQKAKTIQDNYSKQMSAAQAKLPGGAKVTLRAPLGIIAQHATLADTGTVVSAEKSAGANHVMLDMNGDGTPDVDLNIGAKPLPAKGAKLAIAAKLTHLQFDKDGKLQITAIATSIKPA